MLPAQSRVVACGVAAVILSLLAASRRRAVRSVSLHAPGSAAYLIEKHILETQVPARALGIRVASVDDVSLALSAPLAQNRNVHGTAFAGSLYAVGVLSAYYLGRHWMESEGLLDGSFELVARGGQIDYKRPIKSTIVARSVLPPAASLRVFRRTLEAEGKAFIEVRGCMVGADGDERIHCEYTINVCAFRPRSKM